MDSTIMNIRSHLDSIMKYLTPLLPLANCHMVEFFTASHWETLIPRSLRSTLDGFDLNEAVEKFWRASDGYENEAKLRTWIDTARSHCVSVNNEYCLSREQLMKRVGGQGSLGEIKVNEFMSSKKSYEVQTMSSIVATLHNACDANACVEVGGGRGYLLLALSLGYGVRSLTVDCNERALVAAEERAKSIQKVWHAIATNVNKDNKQEKIAKTDLKERINMYRFAKAYVTKDTELSNVVKENFPEINDPRLILTGLHTCGNLGPDSLRIFVSQPSISCVVNVPCCFHLLTEKVDPSLFDVFQRDYGCSDDAGVNGFPMSEYLRDCNLGRNARMLSAQCFERVASLRQLPAKSLLYRALLQVLIKKYVPDYIIADGKMKKMDKKCNSFTDYVKSADAILNLRLSDTATDSELTGNFDSEWKQVVLFHLLRLCLAQVVESVILLDRLLFLMESGFSQVYLVKLFDPVVSPRCHCIVALR